MQAGLTGPGWALLVFSCACMLGTAVVLTTRASRYTRAALTQGTIPLPALVSAALTAL